MTEALIYDHVRTPRGKGKKDGSLHQATPVWLLRGLLQALQQRLRSRHRAASTTSCSAASRRSASRAPTSRAPRCWTPAGPRRVAGVTLSRFCASGLEAVNLAAAKVASGFEDLVVAGGVESHEPLDDGLATAAPGSWIRASTRASRFVPQGISADLIATLEGFSRARPRRVRAAVAPARRRGARRRPLRAVGRAGARHRRPADAGRGRDDPRQRHAGGDGQAGALVRRDGRDGLRRHGAAQVHDGREDRRTCTTPATRRASSTARR